MRKFWLVSAAVFGFLAVLAGTLGAHVVTLDEYGKRIYETAVLYQMFHSVALLGVGILRERFPRKSFSLAGWGFVAGMALFCGSLYLLAATGMKWLGGIAPFGGVAFFLGWAALVLATARAT